MTILVTGGAGFIGSHFIRDWLANHQEGVVNVDCLTYASSVNHVQDLNAHPDYAFVQANILDESCMLELLRRYQIRAVVHFAAESHVDRSIQSPEIFIQSNVVGTFRLLSATLSYWQSLSTERQKTFRFLHVSTDEVFGTLAPHEPAFTESLAYAPNSPYAASKAASDHIVRSFYHTYGLPVLTTHCSNNYGPYQYEEKLIPLCIAHALAGKSLPIYGDGLQIRDWLYVGDHCQAIRLVLETAPVGECYNIGGWNEQTNVSVVQAICHQLDTLQPRSDNVSYAAQITYVRDRAGHDRRYAIDATKIEQDLNWRPQETFETGLLKTVAWYVNYFAAQKNVSLVE